MYPLNKLSANLFFIFTWPDIVVEIEDFAMETRGFPAIKVEPRRRIDILLREPIFDNVTKISSWVLALLTSFLTGPGRGVG